jgi:hypothetical protein
LSSSELAFESTDSSFFEGLSSVSSPPFRGTFYFKYLPIVPATFIFIFLIYSFLPCFVVVN